MDGETVGMALHTESGYYVDRGGGGRMSLEYFSGKSPEEICRELYEVALARQPNDTELAAATKHINGASDRRQAVEDLGWVLINCKEFLFRH